MALVIAGWAVSLVGASYVLFSKYTLPLEILNRWIKKALSEVTAGWIGMGLDWLLRYAKLPPRGTLIDGISSLLSAGALLAIAGYVLAFLAFSIVRQLAMQADRRNYYKFTGTTPTTSWKPVESTEEQSPSESSQ